MDLNPITAPWATASAGFSFDTGFGDVDPYTSFGAGSYTGVYTDVSNSAPAEQPYTPTGNGSGVYVDSSSLGGFWGALEKGLNYAILRDQQKMTAVYGPTMYPAGQAQTAAVSLQASSNNKLLTLMMLAGAAYLLVRK
jgi:hypothetical protein